ncbi:MAG: glycerol-3-phosphate acyltransferase [Trueperaceae bacterium]
MFDTIAALAVGYLLGSLPSAALLARLRDKDVFTVGSGNMGAMNTARNLGYGLGAAVLAIDVGKGALATFVGMRMAAFTQQPEVAALIVALAAGFGAVLGHAFSFLVRFRGGKGLATTFGVSLPLYPWVGLYALVVIVALMLLTRRSELAAILTTAAYPVLTLFTLDRYGWPREHTFVVVTGVLPIVAVVLARHVMAGRQRPQRDDAVTANARTAPPPRR